MSRQIVAGIDIGSSHIKVVVAFGVADKGHFVPKIIGTGVAESRGVHRGYIVDPAEAVSSVRTAIAQAEKTSGHKIKRAYVSFSGVGLGSVVSEGSSAISRADMEITEQDMALALESAETNISKEDIINRKIINTIPIEYKLDGKTSWGEALGLKAHKLEVKALFITCMEKHVADLIKTVESADVEVVDIVAGPIAESFVTLSKKEKRVGALLANIGAETTSIIVFENNTIISLEVLPMGGTDLTGDIALGLKMSLEEAEHLKVSHTSRVVFSQSKLDEIVARRLKEIFVPIDRHLKSIGRQALLPAGAILSGGASATSNMKEAAEAFLKLPAKVAGIHFSNLDEGKIANNMWSVACGLCIVGFNSDDEQSTLGNHMSVDGKKLGRKISGWLSQLLP